ncbi:hypothetical protein BKA57DRAFT_466383 [Linnemannia elongata]|nr:hypothetical protein BKA57DRAFT_466383 [Linnemannia elongata]
MNHYFPLILRTISQLFSVFVFLRSLSLTHTPAPNKPIGWAATDFQEQQVLNRLLSAHGVRSRRERETERETAKH